MKNIVTIATGEWGGDSWETVLKKNLIYFTLITMILLVILKYKFVFNVISSFKKSILGQNRLANN